MKRTYNMETTAKYGVLLLLLAGGLLYYFKVYKKTQTTSLRMTASLPENCANIKDGSFKFCNLKDPENSCYCAPCDQYSPDMTKCVKKGKGDCVIGLGEGEDCPVKYLIRPYCAENPSEPLCAFMAELETNNVLDTNCTGADDFHGCVSAHAVALWNALQAQGRVDLLSDFYEALDTDSCQPNRQAIRCVKKDIETKYKKLFR